MKKDYYCTARGRCPVRNVCYYHYNKGAAFTIELCTNQKLFVRKDG